MERNDEREGNSSRLISTKPCSYSSVVKSIIPIIKRRLTLDPSNKLFFPYEPGKHAKSAIRIENNSKSHVAFKFQTTAPGSCTMKPPGGIISPGESIIAIIYKYVRLPVNDDKTEVRKSNMKFKVISLKVRHDTVYMPELFHEHKDVVTEMIFPVVYLDPERVCPAMGKLNELLAEAEAADEARRRPPTNLGVAEGLVVNDWIHRRQEYLAR